MELHPSEFQLLENESGYSQSQLRKIHRKFKSLDKDGKGYVTVDELLNGIPQLRSMPLATRVCRSVADSQSSVEDQVDFKLLVNTMAIYKSKDPHQITTQIKFLFRMFDTNREGQISKEDLVNVIRDIQVNQNDSLTEEQISEMVNQTYKTKEKQNIEDKQQGKKIRVSNDPNKLAFAEFKRIFDKKQEAFQQISSQSPMKSMQDPAAYGNPKTINTNEQAFIQPMPNYGNV